MTSRLELKILNIFYFALRYIRVRNIHYRFYYFLKYFNSYFNIAIKISENVDLK